MHDCVGATRFAKQTKHHFHCAPHFRIGVQNDATLLVIAITDRERETQFAFFRFVELTALVQGNTLRDVRVTNEDIEATSTALVLEGASAGAIAPNSGIIFSNMQFPGYHQPATIADGTLVRTTFSKNRIDAPQSINLIGGSSLMTEDTVTGGMVQDVRFQGNTILGAGFSVIGGIVTTSGTVTQSLGKSYAAPAPPPPPSTPSQKQVDIDFDDAE